MLRSLRNSAKSWFTKAILFLLVLSFGAWGLSDFGGLRASNPPVAEVAGEEIDMFTVDSEIRREIQRLNPSFGNRLNMETAAALGIPQAVLSRVISSRLVALEADGLGVAASDALVRNTVRNAPQFQSFLGTTGFNRAAFTQVIQSQGYTEEEYLALIREDLVRDQYLSAIEAGIATPKLLSETIYRHRQENRTAETLVVPFTSVPEPTAPADSILEDFHNDRAVQFTAPETRSIALLVLDAQSMADESSITDADIEEAFEAQRDQLSVPERRTLRQIVLSSEADAMRALTRLKSGDDFTAVAEQDAGMTGDATELGTLAETEVLSSIREAAFSTPEGGYSDPVQSALGWHVVAVTAVEPGRDATLEDVRDDLRTQLAADRALDVLYDATNTVEDEIGSGAPLEEAAAAVGQQVITIPALAADGQDRDGNPIFSLPANSGPIVQAAFETEEGLDSTVLELGENAFFVLRVDGTQAPALRPFTEVKDQVLAAWSEENRQAEAEKVAETLKDRWVSGASTDELVAEVSGSTATPEAVTRGETNDDLPRNAVAKLFQLTQPGEAAVARGETGFILVKLKEIIAADPGASHDEVAGLGDQLRNGLITDVVGQLAAALEARDGVTVHENVFAQILDPRLRQDQQALQ